MTFIKSHFPWFLAGGIGMGLLLSPYFAPFAGITDFLVAAIVFVGFFSRPIVKDYPWQVTAFLRGYSLQKIMLPLLLYFATAPFDPRISLGLALIASLPAAAVSPSMTRITGGDDTYSLRFLTYESLASCLSIPAVFLVVASSFAIDPLDVARYLASVLLVPIILAEVLRRLVSHERASSLKSAADLTAIALILLLVILIAAKVQPAMMRDLQFSAVLLALGILLAPFFAAVGVLTGKPASREKAISLAVKTMYVNIGLGLGLSAGYLDEPATLLILTYMIPINMMPHMAAGLGARIFDRYLSGRLSSDFR